MAILNAIGQNYARAYVSAYNAYEYRDLTSNFVVILNPGAYQNMTKIKVILLF